MASVTYEQACDFELEVCRLEFSQFLETYDYGLRVFLLTQRVCTQHFLGRHHPKD